MKPHDTVIFDRRSVAQGQVLIEEGDDGTIAYLIQFGELMVYSEKDGVEVELARLGPGQIVGEMSLIFDKPRSASVRATKDTNVIVITRVQFQDKLAEGDPLLRAVVQMLSQRIVHANNSLLNKRSHIEDLADTARMIYQNVYENIPDNQRYTLQNSVLPHLTALVDEIDAFRDRYKDPSDSV
jgi:CRP/FNR family cyclic AMP-dependent transcriptional regulator